MLGQTVTLDNNPYVIIGVLPRGFSFRSRGDGGVLDCGGRHRVMRKEA